MPDTLTPNYSFVLIEEFGSVDTWGDKINDNMTDVDATIKAIDDAVIAALALKVTGPASSVADRLAVFNGTTGKLVKDGGITVAEIAANLAAGLATKAATAHTHPISDVTALQAALDAKAALAHTHVIGDVTGLQAALDAKSALGLLDGINSQTGTAYTLALTDAGKMVEMNNASANILTIPTNAVAAFPLRTAIGITRMGAGETSIAGAGVTIRSAGSKLRLNGQYSGGTLYKRATDEWVLTGDLKT